MRVSFKRGNCLALQKKPMGRRLRLRRKEMGFNTQNDFAEAVGSDQPTIARWETDTFFPSEDYIEKIKSVLKVGDDFFFDTRTAEEIRESAIKSNLEEAEAARKIEDLEKRLMALEQHSQSSNSQPTSYKGSIIIPLDEYEQLKANQFGSPEEAAVVRKINAYGDKFAFVKIARKIDVAMKSIAVIFDLKKPKEKTNQEPHHQTPQQETDKPTVQKKTS